MVNKIIPLIAVCFFVSVSLVFVLYLSSVSKTKNGFTRVFNLNVAKKIKSINLKYNSYYIAGISADKIFLGNYTAPLHLVSSNMNLDTVHIKLSKPDSAKVLWGMANVAVDSSYIYLCEGFTPTILYTEFSSFEMRQPKLLKTYFTDCLPLSPRSYVIKTLDMKSEQYILAKEMLYQDSIDRAPDILRKQIDGRFCIDGRLVYERSSAFLVYLYWYRNQFICMDTNLHIVYKGSTIDTVTRAQIKVSTIESEGKITMSAPPLKVNNGISVDNNYIYIHSARKADNENAQLFNNSAVIDVYSLREGRYQFSFYIPEKINDFRVTNNYFIAIYDRYLALFYLKLPMKENIHSNDFSN